jgi:predicted ATPase
VRRSVKAARISPEQVAIHFFRQRSENMAQVISPTIDNSGNIDTWPDGFFDQFDKDANYFAGWGE